MRHLSISIIFFLISIKLFAQNDDNKLILRKLDSIQSFQKRAYNEQKAIQNPLANKKYGIEINPVRVIAFGFYPTLSGSFSLFGINRNSELAFPVLFQFQNAILNQKLKVDFHYRYFLSTTQNGFYLSAFVRYQHSNEALLNILTLTTSHIQVDRIGLGVGLGFRVFSNKGPYWGCSLIFGKFITPNPTITSNSSTLDISNLFSNYILDLECLKVGYAF
jgi:hypothetical protein